MSICRPYCQTRLRLVRSRAYGAWPTSLRHQGNGQITASASTAQTLRATQATLTAAAYDAPASSIRLVSVQLAPQIPALTMRSEPGIDGSLPRVVDQPRVEDPGRGEIMQACRKYGGLLSSAA